VHCLGFTRDHDAAFLSALALAGTAQGSFQYIEDRALQLRPALAVVQQVGRWRAWPALVLIHSAPDGQQGVQGARS
jgi:hypothetical protein